MLFLKHVHFLFKHKFPFNSKLKQIAQETGLINSIPDSPHCLAEICGNLHLFLVYKGRKCKVEAEGLSVTSSIICGKNTDKIIRSSCSSGLNRPFVVVKERSPLRFTLLACYL